MSPDESISREPSAHSPSNEDGVLTTGRCGSRRFAHPPRHPRSPPDSSAVPSDESGQLPVRLEIIPLQNRRLQLAMKTGSRKIAFMRSRFFFFPLLVFSGEPPYDIDERNRLPFIDSVSHSLRATTSELDSRINSFFRIVPLRIVVQQLSDPEISRSVPRY